MFQHHWENAEDEVKVETKEARIHKKYIKTNE